MSNQVKRIVKFFGKPREDQRRSICTRIRNLWRFLFPSVPLFARAPYVGWWLVENDWCSGQMFVGDYEKSERNFINSFLKKGWVVLDIGAHHGFYTLIASKKVGRAGRVIAFEPSPRENKRLSLHVRLNHCRNVKVEPLALGNQECEASFFIVNNGNSGCNSLRPPAVSEPTSRVTVSTSSLDAYLKRQGIDHVDFIKIDAEGGELEIFKGAESLLNRKPRPVLMVEVEDVRTAPWGYQALDLYTFLSKLNYHWFLPAEDRLYPYAPRERFDANLVAVPEERLREIGKLQEPNHANT